MVNRWIQIGTLGILLGMILNVTRASALLQGQTPAAQSTQSESNTDQNQHSTTDQSSQNTQEPTSAQPTSHPRQQQTETQASPNEPKNREDETRVHKKAASGKKQTCTATGSQSPDKKVVVRNGGARADAVELSPAVTKEQELHNRENTAQLLATTNENIKFLAGRQLSPAQESMLDEIHTYVRQSKAASASGDMARAHTLAYKAHLLSDELAPK